LYPIDLEPGTGQARRGNPIKKIYKEKYELNMNEKFKNPKKHLSGRGSNSI